MSPMSLRSFAAGTRSRLAASTTEIYQNYTYWGDHQLGQFRIQRSRHRNPLRRLPCWRRLRMVRLRLRRNQRSHVEFGVVRQRRLQGLIAPDAELGPALADAVRLERRRRPVRQLRPPSAQSREWRRLPRGAILFGGQSDTLYGGSTNSMKTIQNGDYKEFAPRVGIAWSPREKWSVRASYGIFDAPRDAENYTDGALGLGFNPHNSGNGGYVYGSYPCETGNGTACRHGRLSDTANPFAGSLQL